MAAKNDEEGDSEVPLFKPRYIPTDGGGGAGSGRQINT